MPCDLVLLNGTAIVNESKTFDVLSVTVPSFLPIVLSITTIYSITRLKKEKIFCIAPARISVSGRVKIMVFDKTGTLTEDNLEIYGFNSCEERGDLIYLGPMSEDC